MIDHTVMVTEVGVSLVASSIALDTTKNIKRLWCLDIESQL